MLVNTQTHTLVWSDVVVSTLALINEVNLRRTQLALRWVTMSGSIPGVGHLFQYVTNQPPKANSAFHPSRVGKWGPASAGKAKAGMVHSDSGWTRGVQVKLWDPLRTRAIPECLRGAFTTRRYTNPRLPLPLHTYSFWRVELLAQSAEIKGSWKKPLFVVWLVMQLSETQVQLHVWCYTSYWDSQGVQEWWWTGTDHQVLCWGRLWR